MDFSKDDADIFGSNHNFFTPVHSKSTTPGARPNVRLASAIKTKTPVGIPQETPLAIHRYRITIRTILDST